MEPAEKPDASPEPAGDLVGALRARVEELEAREATTAALLDRYERERTTIRERLQRLLERLGS